MAPVLFHATSVMIGGHVLLISGRSGSGKSDLALRLIDRGAMLVSDDYTRLEPRDGVLLAAPAPNIEGRMEIRGVGIADSEFSAGGPVALMLDLDCPPPRLPDDSLATHVVCGIAIPTLPFSPFEASAAIKAERAFDIHGLRVAG